MAYKFITIKNNKVVCERQGESIIEGEIENVNNLQCGMELIDGAWGFPPLPTQPKIVTNEEINENQLIIMSALADMYLAIIGG